jgi:MarR family transcriptional regulator for hemolysin
LQRHLSEQQHDDQRDRGDRRRGEEHRLDAVDHVGAGAGAQVTQADGGRSRAGPAGEDRAEHGGSDRTERAMAHAGGSVSTWQVLLLVRSANWETQSELAEQLGITGATLTHHLNALERKGLVRRWREDNNRRVQRVELTDDGLELWGRLREVARRHDRQLRSHLSDEEVEQLGALLARLQAGVEAGVRAEAEPQRSRTL